MTLHKTDDPEFRAACDAAVAEAAALAKERAAAGGSAKPFARWGYIDGEEMVVRAGNGRRAVVARARLRQSTPRTEGVFLRTLAASANVKLACEAAGLSVASAYVHRSKWPAFAERWQAALENGYVRLELALIENACSAFEPGEEFELDAPMPQMTFNVAITLLWLHRQGVYGTGRPGRTISKLPHPDVARANILRKVAAIERGHEAGLKFRDGQR